MKTDKVIQKITLTLIAFAVLFFGASVVMAQDVTTTTLAPVIAAVTAPSTMQNILDWLAKLSAGVWLTVIVASIEFLMRAIPTQNPQSLLNLVSNGLKLAAKLIAALSLLVDNILQNLKPS